LIHMKSQLLVPLAWCLVHPLFAGEDWAAATGSRDPRVREYVSPTRIVWQSEPDAGVVQDAKLLLQPFSGQVTLGNRAACILRNYGKPPGVLLDFGRELHGGLQLAVSDLQAASPASKTVRVRVRFGESVAEAMSDLGGADNATDDHAVRDQTLLVPWLGTTETGNTGFRFVRIDLVDTNTFLALKSARAVYLHRDLQPGGSFRCNDERLNQIWNTGAYTVFLNLQDYVWDGIKRDRLVWIGDMHPETSTIAAVFGSLPVVNASLDLVRSETPLPGWMNGISSYSLWWLIIQRDLFRQTGDLAYLKQQQSYFVGLINNLKSCINADGSEKLPEGRFLDWPSSENPKAIHAGLQSLLILAFEAGAELARAVGEGNIGRDCQNAVAALQKHIPDHGDSKQAAALMLLAGLGNPQKLNRDVLAKDGAHHLSTFYGFYVLQARARVGDYQGALDNIRQFWGAMLDLGATTFWEDFNLDWLPGAARIDELVPPGKKDIHGGYGAYCYKGFRHSLCHGWASGPTAWLSQYVLGVQALEPGCAVVRIDPHLADLEWVEGTFPTSRGVIKIRHEKLPDGKIKSDVEAPPGVKVIAAK
jgi:alpha-L-rhamnosidase